jgi:hypothetical protein
VPVRRIPSPDGCEPWTENSVLDIVCVLGILALAAIVALVGRGVEKL